MITLTVEQQHLLRSIYKAAAEACAFRERGSISKAKVLETRVDGLLKIAYRAGLTDPAESIEQDAQAGLSWREALECALQEECGE